ncbi:hypothetical protein COOONC_20987 [Cooperia oncophora]
MWWRTKPDMHSDSGIHINDPTGIVISPSIGKMSWKKLPRHLCPFEACSKRSEFVRLATMNTLLVSLSVLLIAAIEMDQVSARYVRTGYVSDPVELLLQDAYSSYA